MSYCLYFYCGVSIVNYYHTTEYGQCQWNGHLRCAMLTRNLLEHFFYEYVDRSSRVELNREYIMIFMMTDCSTSFLT